MAQTVRVVALRAFTHDGQRVRAAAALDVTPVMAAVLTRRGDARFARASDRLHVQTAAVAAEEEAPAIGPGSPGPRRRRYKRRDLAAEE